MDSHWPFICSVVGETRGVEEGVEERMEKRRVCRAGEGGRGRRWVYEGVEEGMGKKCRKGHRNVRKSWRKGLKKEEGVGGIVREMGERRFVKITKIKRAGG